MSILTRKEGGQGDTHKIKQKKKIVKEIPSPFNQKGRLIEGVLTLYAPRVKVACNRVIVDYKERELETNNKKNLSGVRKEKKGDSTRD